MNVFTRPRSAVIIRFVIVIFPAAAVFLLLRALLKNTPISLCVSAALYIAAAVLLYLRGNIRFEMEVGRLRFYRRGRLRGNYFLNICRIRPGKRYKSKKKRGRPELFLNIVWYSGEKVKIDCTPLGENRFDELLLLLTDYYAKHPAKNPDKAATQAR